jgi:hypothetical protein
MNQFFRAFAADGGHLAAGHSAGSGLLTAQVDSGEWIESGDPSRSGTPRNSIPTKCAELQGMDGGMSVSQRLHNIAWTAGKSGVRAPSLSDSSDSSPPGEF